MKQISLQGCYTALVTPFQQNGDVDEAALLAFVDWQIGQGINGLVPCGTTGESVTLSTAEYQRVLKIVIEHVAGRVPIICGAGGNNTKDVIAKAKYADSIGADAILSVTPYYNKPTQQGLIAHYQAIAEAVNTPIILYNVPGRTSVNLSVATTLELAQIANIVAVKEASGDLVQVMEILRNRPKDFFVLSGDDALTLPMIAAGADGVISVIANQIPNDFTNLVQSALKNDFNQARTLQQKYLKLMQLNFIETNPTPVKAALTLMGYIKEAVRLPLVPIQAASKSTLEAELRDLKLLS